MIERKIYLDSVAPREAFSRLEAALAKARWGGEPERIPVEEARGRVTAAPVLAAISVPHFHAAAMDGVAVRPAETFGATETSPVRLRLGEQAVWRDTGDPLPPGFEAVIMVEHINRVGEDEIEIYAAASPWQYVRPMGEDVVASEVVVPAGSVVRGAEVGAMLAAGVGEVDVWRRPVVTFIPTGTELVHPTSDPEPGKIIEFNSRLILAEVEAWGGAVRRWGIVPDDYERIKAAVAQAVAESDIVIVNAGSSAGAEDYTVHVLGDLGDVIVHGVNIKPAKPVVLAVVEGKPVIGLPGYPVSAWLAADLFLKPLVYRFQSLQPPRRREAKARLVRRLTSPMGVEDYVLVRLGQVGERLVATPISRGAAMTSSLVRADGILVVADDREGIEEGEDVSVQLLKPLRDVKAAAVATGSHDIVLDLVSSWLRRRGERWTLSSAHVGSLGGLAALRRGEAHLAGVHLLDPETGDYNLPYVRRYLRRPARLVLLCRRQQGFIVAPGNPKGIQGVADLGRPDVRIVNRQRGAGTRILLDYELERAGLSPEDVQGYEREEYTHLAVAAAVRSGAADCGLGILAAADALGLDFIPLAEEEYELCIPVEHWDHPGVQAVLALIEDEAFRREVEALGGYDLKEAGRVRDVE